MKRIFLTLFAAGLVFAVSAQAPVKQSIKIPVDQLPLVVRQAYEKDFGTLPQEGWTAFVVTTSDGKRTSAKPVYYGYSRRDGKKKIEIKFSPEGEITFLKGIENPNQQTTGKGSSTADGL
jgi:hypothetical protein